MNDLELKRKKIETIVKVAAVLGISFIAGPFILVTLQGLIGLIVAAVIVLFGINVFAPWFAVKMANWRLQALKAEAAKNPIETLENQYAQKETALAGIRDNIKEFSSVVRTLADEIRAHNEKYPDRPSQFVEKFKNMKALFELRKAKYLKAKDNLAAFAVLIEEKRSDWKIFQMTNKASKLANVGEDFQNKLLQDTAVSAIQDGLNFSFAELDASLLDEQTTVSTATVTVSASKSTRLLNDKQGNDPLSLDIEDFEDEGILVPARRS